MYALIDCNNFYASCERLFRPDLNGKPIVVLSNNDGCVIARSNEAKAVGIPMGAPAFEYEKVFSEYDVKVFSANFALYGDLSNRVMVTLNTFCPDMEIYSIDEAFLKFNGFQNLDYTDYGITIKKTVQRNIGIPISVGYAPTKALAKVANKIAKKFPSETQGVYMIDNEAKRIKALQWLPIGDVWGIGRQYAKRLVSLGIKTAYDFTMMHNQWVHKNMSIVGLRLKRELEGKETLSLDIVKPKKNIATTRSFERNYTTYEDIKERVITFAVSCAEKLRKQNSCTNRISVFLMTNAFREDMPQYNNSIVVKIPFPTNSSFELAKYASIGLDKIFKKGYSYKKAGVIVMDFTPETATQINIFENSNPRHKKVMAVVDKLNQSIGQQKIKLATQDKGRIWKMKQEKLSPRYTTRLSEIIDIFV